MEAYERNFNFSGAVIDLPAETKVEWPTTGYKQITPHHHDVLTHTTEAHVESNLKQTLCRQSVLNCWSLSISMLLFYNYELNPIYNSVAHLFESISDSGLLASPLFFFNISDLLGNYYSYVRPAWTESVRKSQQFIWYSTVYCVHSYSSPRFLSEQTSSRQKNDGQHKDCSERKTAAGVVESGSVEH